MKTNKFFTRILALALLSVAPLVLTAQQDPMISQYMFSGHFLNPAYAGSHPYSNITLLGRKQWVGIDGSPFTSYLSFDMPLANQHIGIGALVSNDQIGVTKRTQVSGTFAYHLHLSERARLAAGLSLGAQFYSAKLSKLTVWDEDDVVFNSDIAGKTLPVAGAGLYFYTTRFYAGLSIPNVINYKPGTFLYVGGLDAPRLERHYFGTVGYAIPAGKNLDIKPSILVKYVPKAPVEFDFNLNFLLYKTLWLGGGYRQNDGLVAMVEYQATKNLRVGYSYDYALTHLMHYNSGTHEIMLAWDFIKDDNIRYKSPRFF
jgi:type IX secretion system PorP/SprF family membrane protein